MGRPAGLTERPGRLDPVGFASEWRDLLGDESGLAEEAVQVGLAPELDDASVPEPVGLDPGHGEVPAGAVVGVGQGEGHGDTVVRREEVIDLNAAVGQARCEH